VTDFTGAPDTGIVGDMWNTANQFADYQGGWGNAAKKVGNSYVQSHGGAAGTAQHLGHSAVNAVANAAWGAKDWGNAYRSAKAGDWKHALSSGLWGLASVGATASMIVPGAGEAIKGAELGAQAARVGGEAVAKDAAEMGAKGAIEEGATGVEEAGKAAKWAHRAHSATDAAISTVDRYNTFMNAKTNAEIMPQTLVNPRIY